MMTTRRLNATAALAAASGLALALTACTSPQRPSEAGPNGSPGAEAAASSPVGESPAAAESSADTAVEAAAADAGDRSAADDPAQPNPDPAPPDADPAPIDIPNARAVDGVLTGGQPEPAHIEDAADTGYETVISFQPSDEAGAAELRERAEEAGIDYEVIPVAGAEGLTLQNAETFAEALEDAERDVLVHCASGNRVGAMYALKAHFVDGASAEEAEDIGERAGMTSLSDAVNDVLADDEDPHGEDAHSEDAHN